MDVAEVDRSLASIYRGTPWIVVAEPAAATTLNVGQLQDWGVERILVIAATEGVGPLPDGVLIHLTGAQADTLMAGIRAFAASLESATVTDVIASFDPDGSARVLSPPFGMGSALAGRPAYGARWPVWRSLENKMEIDDHFRRAGVSTAPSEVVPVAEAPAATRRLASELGSVWVADNREGWHGGGEYVQWVRGSGDVASALEWFTGHADRVRVMPFLDGIPCSIHGYVTRRGISAFRPVEMLIARQVGSPRFRYLGMATTWDPPQDVRDRLRDAARQMGAYLARTVSYRGPFSIDGVLTVDGFLPTELNPRMSAGFGIQAARVGELKIGLLTRAVVEGDIDVDPEDLERLILDAADRQRSLRIGIPVAETRPADSIPIVISGDVIARTTGEPHGTLDIGPASSGSYVLIRPEDEHIPIGRSAAGLAVSTARLAAETWDLAIGGLQPAVDVGERST